MTCVRGKKGKAGPVVLTPRDYELLQLVGITRYLSTEQVARELFPTVDRCRRRLRALFDAGLVRVTLAGSTKPNLVSLTRHGLTTLAREDPTLGVSLHLPGVIRLAGIEHHLGVVDARLYLAALARRDGGTVQAFESAAGALGRALGFANGPLRPDAVARLAFADGATTVALEVDTGSEASRALAPKFARYRDILGSVVEELWVIASGGPGRLAHVAALAAAAGVGEATRILPVELVRARPVVAPPGRVGGTGAGAGAIRLPHQPESDSSPHSISPGVTRASSTRGRP